MYVGNGFGLCLNYTHPASCEEEKHNPPHQALHERLLTVSYTGDMLTSTWSRHSMWFSYPASDHFRVVDFGLGWDKRNKNPKEDYYWEAVRDAIIKPALESSSRKHDGGTDRVFLHGECSTDERFQKVLKEAVDAALEKKPQIFALDPVYSAARGAAEIAKRAYWSYNHTQSAEGTMSNDL